MATAQRDKNGKIIGYKGGSHRGMMVFKIGMKLFDEKWKMPKTHKDYKKYESKLKKSEFSDKIESVIPFNERGSKTIATLAEAKKAANNFSDYMS